MKKRITLLKIFMIFLVAGLSIVVLMYNQSLRVPSIFDGRFYTTATIAGSTKPYAIPEKRTALPDLEVWADSAVAAAYQYPDFLLQNTSTTAFLVLRNDTLIFKRYMNGIREGDNTQLFSITKVFVTAMLGMAIRDNYISDAQVPVTNYFTDLPGKQFKSLTLRHLAQMRSGLDYDEYGRLFQTLQYYYDKNLTRSIYGAQFVQAPGKQFMYKSIDTQILGECIKKALGDKKLLDYFQQEFSEALGMQDTSYWALDSRITSNPKYYGGLNMSARDLAKFGIMVMQNGKYRNKQMMPREWFSYCDDSLNRCTEEDRYCMGWYYSIDDCDSDIYYAAGFNGQIMLINEARKVIIIRLGKDRGGVNWYPLMRKLSESV